MRSVSNGVSRYFAYTNQSVYQNSKAFIFAAEEDFGISDINNGNKGRYYTDI